MFHEVIEPRKVTKQALYPEVASSVASIKRHSKLTNFLGFGGYIKMSAIVLSKLWNNKHQKLWYVTRLICDFVPLKCVLSKVSNRKGPVCLFFKWMLNIF